MLYQLNHLSRFSVCLLVVSQFGCRNEVEIEGDMASQRDLTIHRTVQGQDFKMPARLEFDGETWTRSGEIDAKTSGIVTCDYFGDDPNTKLRYSQWPKQFNLKETLSKEVRSDQVSTWEKSGKQRLVTWDGVWREYTADAELGGIPNGPYQYSYEDGALKFSGHERDFSRVGPAKGFYPDGELWWKGEFVDDSPEYPSMQFWSRDGNEMKDLDLEEKRDQYHLWNDMKRGSSN